MESLRNNENWDIVTLPNGRKTISSKWVFKGKKMQQGRLRSSKLD